MASIGLHASQFDHMDMGATSLLYRTQAVAPCTAVPPDLLGWSPAISAYKNSSMKPRMTETVQTKGEIVPTIAEIAPRLNITRAGEPAAMKTTCNQFTSRRWRGSSKTSCL